jgi:membrane protein DedA with SNARE-associated domain
MRTLLNSLTAYPYVVLLLAGVMERVGFPLLLTPVLVGAGALAAVGQMRLDIALWVTLLACIAGDTLWYELGRKRGDSVLSTLCRISFEPQSCVRRSKNFFAKSTNRTLLFSKWLPGVSHVIPAVAGLSGVGRQHFFFANLAGSALWVLPLLLAGYLPVERVHVASAVGPIAFEAGLFLLVGNVGIKYVQKRRFMKELYKARIAPQDLLQMLNSGEKLSILDLRHPLDSVTDPRTLPGAIRVLPDDVAGRAASLPKDQEIILYCT